MDVFPTVRGGGTERAAKLFVLSFCVDLFIMRLWED